MVWELKSSSDICASSWGGGRLERGEGGGGGRISEAKMANKDVIMDAKCVRCVCDFYLFIYLLGGW